MQESLYNTVRNFADNENVNVQELESQLDCEIEEIVSLCKKACVKPKTDAMGNAYFTKDEVNMLKKIKELYSQSTTYEKKSKPKDDFTEIDESLTSPNKKLNFLAKAKTRQVATINETKNAIGNRIDALENNIISKMSELLSEKMDGFDEIIVELIRSKTENENLRSQINSLNKENFALKNELACYQPLALNLYIKKENEQV